MHDGSKELAERGGFEPPVPMTGTAVFETAPFGRSGTSPITSIQTGGLNAN